MIIPGRLDLTALRWQPFRFSIEFRGLDFTGADFQMQVRPYRDAPNPALISLGSALPGNEGLIVPVDLTGDVPVSTVTINIFEATIEALPFTNPRGTDFAAVWDLVITPVSGLKTRWLEGNFIVHGGSTQT